MSIVEIIILAIGLAMDAFAVSICKGLACNKSVGKKALIAGLYFGLFQAIMPLIGYLLGSQFEHLIKNVDHWIAFGLLLILGIKMIIEAFKKEENLDDSFSFKVMIVLALATSIDALAVGITFSVLNTSIYLAILIIGVITFILSFIGVKLGNLFGSKFQKTAQIIGGIILILIGVKILLEHLNVF